MSTVIHFIGLDVHKESVAMSIAPANSTPVAAVREEQSRSKANCLCRAASYRTQECRYIARLGSSATSSAGFQTVPPALPADAPTAP
jgi:hypothetical protein